MVRSPCDEFVVRMGVAEIHAPYNAGGGERFQRTIDRNLVNLFLEELSYFHDRKFASGSCQSVKQGDPSFGGFVACGAKDGSEMRIF